MATFSQILMCHFALCDSASLREIKNICVNRRHLWIKINPPGLSLCQHPHQVSMSFPLYRMSRAKWTRQRSRQGFAIDWRFHRRFAGENPAGYKHRNRCLSCWIASSKKASTIANRVFPAPKAFSPSDVRLIRCLRPRLRKRFDWTRLILPQAKFRRLMFPQAKLLRHYHPPHIGSNNRAGACRFGRKSRRHCHIGSTTSLALPQRFHLHPRRHKSYNDSWEMTNSNYSNLYRCSLSCCLCLMCRKNCRRNPSRSHNHNRCRHSCRLCCRRSCRRSSLTSCRLTYLCCCLLSRNRKSCCNGKNNRIGLRRHFDRWKMSMRTWNANRTTESVREPISNRQQYPHRNGNPDKWPLPLCSY